MRTPIRSGPFWILYCVAVCASGCADVSSLASSDPASAAVFDGRWHLDTQASDDVRARLVPLLERNERHWRRSAERYDDSPPPSENGTESNDDGVSNMRWLQHQRQKDVETLLEILSPATQLDIQHSDRSIRIATNKSEGTRVLTPGETSSLFLLVGSFTMSSSWEKGSLLIEVRGTGDTRLRIIERFTRKGEQLQEHLEVKGPTIGKQSFHIVYKQ